MLTVEAEEKEPKTFLKPRMSSRHLSPDADTDADADDDEFVDDDQLPVMGSVPSIVNMSSPRNQDQVFRGVVFGRSIRTSFCSIHVARVRSIDAEYRTPPRTRSSIHIPDTRETCDDRHLYHEENHSSSSSSSSSDESVASDESPNHVALIRIQFMVDDQASELRSYCRRFIKNGDLLSIVIPSVHPNENTVTSSATTNAAVTWQDSPNINVQDPIYRCHPTTIWQGPRLVVNIDNVAQATLLLPVERRNVWSMRQYQAWQRAYLPSPPTVAATTATQKSFALVETKIMDHATMSHHGGGLKKRTQGEFVANFLLHVMATKLLSETQYSNPYRADPSKWAEQNLQEFVSPHDFRTVIEKLNIGAGVYDVAGGSGHVSMALGLMGVSSTVVDPREKAGKLPKRDRKMFHKSLKRKLSTDATPSMVKTTTESCHNETMDVKPPPVMYCQPVAVPFETLRAWFGTPPDGVDTNFRHPDQTAVSVLDDDRIQSCTAIVALHPDEATDAIVATAVRFRIPFVIVPCCVFNRLFQHRRMPHQPNTPVSSYQDLLEYLQHKHTSIQKATLPFVGSNTILWSYF